MACYHPWYLNTPEAARRPLQKLPCGQCVGCRKARAREWAMRCMHEASLHEDNCFLTLTYDDEHLPAGGSLDRRAFPLFMKRLRKRLEPQKVRYFHVGEYGESSNRPHYHCLLFGFDPPDKTLLSVRQGFPVFTSDWMREAWPYGLHELGSVTPQSAAYVARYVRKKITGSWSKAKYGDKEPEYATMSRNPGIGRGWIEKYGAEVFPSDDVVFGGRLCKPPRYYCEVVAKKDGVLIEEVKFERFKNRDREEEQPERLRAREVCDLAQMAMGRNGGL